MESHSNLPFDGPSTPQRNSRLYTMRQSLHTLFTTTPNIPRADTAADAPKHPASHLDFTTFSPHEPAYEPAEDPADDPHPPYSPFPPSPVSPQSLHFPDADRMDYIAPLQLHRVSVPAPLAQAAYPDHYRHPPGFDVQTGTWEYQENPILPEPHIRAARAPRQEPKPKPPQRFCFPSITNKAVRSKIFSCLGHGALLAIILTLYLALAISQSDRPELFHISFILVILTLTILFCHALIRVCMLALISPAEARRRKYLNVGRYVLPEGPIRVIAAQDLDVESASTKLPPPPPPAYGLWRCSARANPDLLYWQRNENAPPLIQADSTATSRAGAPLNGYYAPRPPSYMSDDGVEYALEPLPRSTVQPPSVH